MVHLLIVDDHVIFSESLKIMIEKNSDQIAVVGMAKNGKEAIDMLSAFKVDVILMDIHMPVMDGLEAIKRIRASGNPVKILVLATYDDDDFVQEAIALGSNGYLLKTLTSAELISSIRAVCDGVYQFSREVFHPSGERQDQEKLRNLKTLTKREEDILSLLLQHMSNGDIADTLSLNEHTVRNYISTLYSKLEVSDRYSLVSGYAVIFKRMKK